MIEIWKDIKGYDGDYQISNLGRIKSLMFGKEKILKSRKDTNGYYGVVLYKNHKKYSKRIHRLVLENFNPIENMDKLEVNHKDGIKSNNILENLEWCDRLKNERHAYEIGLKNKNGINNPQSKLKNNNIIEIRKLLKENNLTQEEIGKLFGVSKTTISLIKLNKIWVHI